MKLFTKVMAAALLSTALSGASMATDLSTLAADLKIDAARAALKVVKKGETGLDCDVTIDKDLVRQLSAFDTSKITAKTSKRVFDGIKALYGELSAAAGGDDKLISVLSKGELKVVLSLDPSKENADYNKAVNTPVIESLKTAVVDDPFVAIRAAAKDLLALKGTPSAARKTDNTKYATVAAMITAFEAAEAEVKDPSKKDAALKAANDILAEMATLKIGKAARRDLTYLAAKESKADYGVSDVRAAKSAALKKAVHVPTDAEKLASESYASLLELASDGYFASLGFEDADAIKEKAKVDSLLKLIVESIAQKNSMQDRIVELQREVAALKSGKGGSGSGSSTSGQGQGGGGSSSSGHPALDGISEEHRAAVVAGWATYDPDTGVFKATNGSVTHQY